MFKKIIFSCFLLFLYVAFAQEKKTCESLDDNLIADINSITKCSVENTNTEKKSSTNKKPKRISVRVSSTRKKVFRKRRKNANAIKTNNGLANLEKMDLAEKLNLSNTERAKKLPFAMVEEKPNFKACSEVSLIEQAKCFRVHIQKHIKNNFDYPKISYDKNIQGRVLVQFVINEDGTVDNIITKGPYKGEELEKEAKRIITKLPKLIPGKMMGKNVKVKYGVPISFKIRGKKRSNIKIIKKTKVVSEDKLGEIVDFSEVHHIPTFKVCGNNTDILCFNTEMIKHIEKYFAYPVKAVNNNIEGKVEVKFIINKNGEVINIQAKDSVGGNVILEYSAKRVVEKLPNFIPAKHNGVVTNVRYSIPIDFKLE